MGIEFRWMSPAEQDAAGLSAIDDCSICRASECGECHTCGRCGVLIHHPQGSTCADCWRLVFDAQRDPDTEGTP